MIIRDALDADLPQIVEIVNAFLPSTTTEWRDTPYTLDDRREWLAQHRRVADPVLVADIDGEVAGFSIYGDFRDSRKWPGYRRVCALGISLDAAHIAGDFERAERCLPMMHAIASEDRDADRSARLHGLILTWEIQLARARNDAARINAKLQEGLSLLEELEKTTSSPRALLGYRHNLAHHLTQSGRHDLALPVLDANLAAGGGSHGDHGYTWMMHAASVWKVTRDRSRTLALLREARDRDPRDLTNEFRIAAFDDVQDDPEFLQAISRAPFN